MSAVFRDRRDAGRFLAARLGAYAGRDDVVVLALPRGGVPVGFEVASSLGAPLDVFLVRKLGVPGHEELALGALGSGGAIVLNDDVIEALGIDRETIEEVVGAEQRELERRERLYRHDRPPVPVGGKVVIVVDDGLATGASMRAAVAALRRHDPSRIVVAVTVAPRETCSVLRDEADETVCAITPVSFYAVGAHYDDFTQTTDEEVRELLRAARAAPGLAAPGEAARPQA